VRFDESLDGLETFEVLSPICRHTSLPQEIRRQNDENAATMGNSPLKCPHEFGQ
jgi:hypothetical protein